LLLHLRPATDLLHLGGEFLGRRCDTVGNGPGVFGNLEHGLLRGLDLGLVHENFEHPLDRSRAGTKGHCIIGYLERRVCRLRRGLRGFQPTGFQTTIRSALSVAVPGPEQIMAFPAVERIRSNKALAHVI